MKKQGQLDKSGRIIRFLRYNGLVFLILIATGYLSLQRLDNTYLWDDEATAAIVGRNFLATGRFSGWDGRNLLAYRNGMTLDEDLCSVNPPLEFVVVAGSFRLFGATTWAGRFPFVLAGLASLLIFLLLLRAELPGRGTLHIYALAALGFSMFFLLYIRQCRYYSLSLLFPLLSFYAYRRGIVTKRTGYFILFSIATVLSFYANYLVCAAFLIALALIHLAFHRHELEKQHWRKVALAVGLIVVAIVPYAVYHRIWYRPDIPAPGALHERIGQLLWWYVKNFNSSNILPWPMAIGLIYFVLRYRKKVPEAKVAVRWLALTLTYVVFLTLLLPRPGTITPVRYLIPVVPLLTGALATLLWFLHRLHVLGKVAAVLLLAIMLTSNVLGLTPAKAEFRWLLPAYLGEIHRPYPTSTRAVVDYLREHAGQDELVFAHPDYFNYPLMFYLTDKVKFCCLLDSYTTVDPEQVRKLQAPLLLEENFPDWFISFAMRRDTGEYLTYFSRSHVKDGKFRRNQYKLVSSLDVFCLYTCKPRLLTHTFRPITNFNRKTRGVYIFKRIGQLEKDSPYLQVPVPLKQASKTPG